MSAENRNIIESHESQPRRKIPDWLGPILLSLVVATTSTALAGCSAKESSVVTPTWPAAEAIEKTAVANSVVNSLEVGKHEVFCWQESPDSRWHSITIRDLRADEMVLQDGFWLNPIMVEGPNGENEIVWAGEKQTDDDKQPPVLHEPPVSKDLSFVVFENEPSSQFPFLIAVPEGQGRGLFDPGSAACPTFP